MTKRETLIVAFVSALAISLGLGLFFAISDPSPQGESSPQATQETPPTVNAPAAHDQSGEDTAASESPGE